MKNKLTRIVVFIASLLILLSSSYSLYMDINYFLSKRETQGSVLDIEDQGDHNPLKIKVRYKNDFINKWYTTDVELESSYVDKLKKSDLKHVKIFYPKGYPDRIYLVDFKKPRLAIIFVHLSLIILMCVGVLAALKP